MVKKGNDRFRQSLARHLELVLQRLARFVLSDPSQTAAFIEAYARFIGERKEIEAKNMRWDRLIEDKTPEMTVWIQELKKSSTKG